MLARRIALSALGAVLLVGGCQKTVNQIERQNPLATADVVADKRITYDGDVSDIAQPLQVIQGMTGDLLKIEITVRNNRAKTQNINYKFEWVDGSGFAVSTPTSIWQPLVLEGKEVRTILGIAPTPTCKDFRIKFQESKR